MISYEQVMELTRTISAPAAFEEPCCELMYWTVNRLQPGSTIVEVGVEYGRSTSILAQVAKDQGHRLILIDPFVDALSGVRAMEMLTKVGCEFTLFKMTTWRWLTQGLSIPDDSVNLLHVDGDHTTGGVTTDLVWLLPKVAAHGYFAAHDYGRDSLPDVYPTVNIFMDERWEPVATANTLGVWRRK